MDAQSDTELCSTFKRVIGIQLLVFNLYTTWIIFDNDRFDLDRR
jgi:hypothetical protein